MKTKLTSAAAAVAVAFAAVSCASLEPKSGEPVPKQVAKGVVYYPLLAVGLVGWLLFDSWCDDNVAPNHEWDEDRTWPRPPGSDMSPNAHR